MSNLAGSCLQVLWSYGSRSNDDFFAYHGFALPDNPDEDVVLFDDVQQLVGWALQHLPSLQALQAHMTADKLALLAGKLCCAGPRC
jgi:hypothetical protein